MFFTGAVKACFSKYVEYRGRSPRSEFWYWTLFVFLGYIVTGILDYMIFGPSGHSIFNIVFYFGTLLPGLFVGVRRLHDIGRSGWWLLLSFIPLIGFLVLLYWFVQRSDPTQNRFGPPPPHVATVAPEAA